MRDGLGFFYASADMLDPEASAKRAAAFGASWCAVLVESVDKRRQAPARVKAAVDALRAQDIEPILYTFPHPTIVGEATSRAIAAAKANRISVVMIDAEPFDGHDWTAADLALAHRLIVEAGLEPAWTTFYRRRWGALRWPRAPMFLQVYERVRDRDELDRAISLFGSLPVILCIGTHLNDARVAPDLSNATRRSPKAIGVWCLATTSATEGAALREWVVRGQTAESAAERT